MRRHRVFHQFPAKPAGWQPGDPGYGGRPDGAAVDVEGHYWVAMFEGGRLLRLSPSGEVVAEFPLPARCPTMPCFGGPDGRTLYVTTARHGRPAAELEALPHSGCVLAARVEVPGLPANFFID
jgi:sugar lactone lactonase YvrE